jgi:ribosome-associated protein
MPSQTQEKISRTKKKKAALALQQIGERLVNLGHAQLKELELPEELLEAILLAKEIRKHEARRRQMQYIGSLMRQCDGSAIEKAMEEMTRQDDAEARRFKQIERWREELLNGDKKRFQWLVDRFPQTETTKLDALVQEARRGDGRIVTKKAARKLFRYLRTISEENAEGKTDQ